MAQFSGTVKIGDLNDFIAPSQACVVSLQGAPDAQPPAQLREEEGKVKLNAVAPRAVAAPGGFQQTTTPGGADGPVKVSLNDCLACSGCVTSAETVLLENQSTGELAAKLTEPGAVVVVSVSPQSRASLAVFHGIPAAEVQARVTAALRQIGVAAVWDVGVARELALAEAAEEFMARYAHARDPAAAAAAGLPAAGPLPMLASACPGWVCYAEKTQAGSLLPHISTAKSPQAVMGALVKRALAPLRGWDPARVYHATVMPCYDKKLEAARDDFKLPGTSLPEVDNCLTTGELQQLLDAWGLGRLAEVDPTPLDALLPEVKAPGRGGASSGGGAAAANGGGAKEGAGWEAAYPYPPGEGAEPPLHGALGSSGGYLEAVARAAAAALLGPGAVPPAGAPLPAKVGRNPDLREVTLSQPAAAAAAAAGSPGPGSLAAAPRPLRFVAAYGFRNIQSLVRKVKLGRCEYDYAEVMACPGGCLNGGGQAKPRPGVGAAALLDELEQAYVGGGGGGEGCGGGGGEACGGGGGGACGGGGGGAANGGDCGGGSCACSNGGGGGGGACAMDVDGEAAVANGGAPGAAAAQPQQPWRPPLSAAARAVYRDFVGGGPGSPAARALLHTQYHHRAKTALGTVGDW